jgi:hypothetical protein
MPVRAEMTDRWIRLLEVLAPEVQARQKPSPSDDYYCVLTKFQISNVQEYFGESVAGQQSRLMLNGVSVFGS